MLAKGLPMGSEISDLDPPSPVEADASVALGRVIHDINGRRATLGMELLAAQRLVEGLDGEPRELLLRIFANLTAVGEKLGQSVVHLRDLRTQLRQPPRSAVSHDLVQRLDDASTTALKCAAGLFVPVTDPDRMSACAADLVDCARSLQDMAGHAYESSAGSTATFALTDRARRTVMIAASCAEELRPLEAQLRCSLQNTWIIALHNRATALEILEAPDGPHLDLLVVEAGKASFDGVELVRRARRHQPDLPVLVVTARELDLEDGRDCVVLRRPFEPNDLVDEVLCMLMPELCEQEIEGPGLRC